MTHAAAEILSAGALLNRAATVHRSGDGWVAPIGDRSAAIHAGGEGLFGVHFLIYAAADARIDTRGIDGAHTDLATAGSGCEQLRRATESLRRGHVSAAGNRHTVDVRRHDLDVEVVAMRAAFIAG